MAEFRLQAGASIDILNQKELDHSLGSLAHDSVIERGRGVKWMRMPTLSGTMTGTFPTTTSKLGGTGLCGPNPGYCWAVRRIAAINLSASTDQLYVYRNEPVVGQFIGAMVGQGATNFISFTNVQFVLAPGDELIIAPGASFSSSNVITITGEAVEVPAEMLWKIA